MKNRPHRSASMKQLIKEGFLTKRALKSGRNWKRRYFALNGCGLAYFKSYGDKKPKGVIDLTQHSAIRRREDVHPFAFEILGPCGIVAYAESQFDLDDWVTALNKAVGKSRSKKVTVRSDCEGWMMKRGGRWKSWKKRFFALYDDELVYFKTAKAERDIGKINLKKALDVQFDCQKECPEGWIPFRIFSMERTWLLCCETEEEIEMWKNAIIKKGKIRHRQVVHRNAALERPKSMFIPKPGEALAQAAAMAAPLPPPPPSDDDESDNGSALSDVPSTPPDTPPGTPPRSGDEGPDGNSANLRPMLTNKAISTLISRDHEGARRRASSAPSLKDLVSAEESAGGENPSSRQQQWERHLHDATGTPYYHNRVTGVTQWTRPADFEGDYDDDTDSILTQTKSMASLALSSANDSDSSAPPSPANQNGRSMWTKYHDDATGRPYWHNASTGETLWHDPTAATARSPSAAASTASSFSSSDWIRYVDDASERPYWHNPKTGKTVWQKPEK